MSDNLLKGIFGTIYAVGTAAAVVFAPPLGAGLVAAQSLVAAGTEVASEFVKDEDTKKGLEIISEVCSVGAAAGGLAGAKK